MGFKKALAAKNVFRKKKKNKNKGSKDKDKGSSNNNASGAAAAASQQQQTTQTPPVQKGAASTTPATAATTLSSESDRSLAAVRPNSASSSGGGGRTTPPPPAKTPPSSAQEDAALSTPQTRPSSRPVDLDLDLSPMTATGADGGGEHGQRGSIVDLDASIVPSDGGGGGLGGGGGDAAAAALLDGSSVGGASDASIGVDLVGSLFGEGGIGTTDRPAVFTSRQGGGGGGDGAEGDMVVTPADIAAVLAAKSASAAKPSPSAPTSPPPRGGARRQQPPRDGGSPSIDLLPPSPNAGGQAHPTHPAQAEAAEESMEVVEGSGPDLAAAAVVVGTSQRAANGGAAAAADGKDAPPAHRSVGSELDAHVADVSKELGGAAASSPPEAEGGNNTGTTAKRTGTGAGTTNTLVDLDVTPAPSPEHLSSPEAAADAAAAAAAAPTAQAAAAAAPSSSSTDPAAAGKPPLGVGLSGRIRSIPGFGDIPAMDDWSKFLSVMTNTAAATGSAADDGAAAAKSGGGGGGGGGGIDSVKRTLFESTTGERGGAVGGGGGGRKRKDGPGGRASPPGTGPGGQPFDQRAELDPTFLDEERTYEASPSPAATAAAKAAALYSARRHATTASSSSSPSRDEVDALGEDTATLGTAYSRSVAGSTLAGETVMSDDDGTEGGGGCGRPIPTIMASGMGAARSLLAAFDCAQGGGGGRCGGGGGVSGDGGSSSTVLPGLTNMDDLCRPIIGTVKDRTMPKPLYDEEFTLRFLKEVTEKGIPILIHQPPSDNDPKKDWTQKTVRIFIKPGNCQGSYLIQPKLSWARNKALPPTVIKTGSPESKSVGKGKVRWTSVDLLDVHSILGSGSSEKDASPQQRREKARTQEDRNDDDDIPAAADAADSQTCFFTVTSGRGDVYVFEAMTAEERDRVANGIRSVISRLTYNLITGNMAASTELVKNDDDDHGLESGELPSLRTPTQAMNEITHAFLD